MKRNPANQVPSFPGVAGRVGWAAARVVVGAGALVLAGCARFERDWKRALATPGADGGGVTAERSVAAARSAWTGRWTSVGTGHEGSLRCLVSGATGGEVAAEAAFVYHATWGVFSGTFSTRQPVERRRDGSVRSAGSWTLPPWAGGRYDYDITINGDQFSGAWQGGGDRGTFEMMRAPGRAQ